MILPGIYGICKVIKLIYRYYNLRRSINSHFNNHSTNNNNINSSSSNNNNNNTSVTLSLNSIRSQENELLSDFD